MDVHLRRLAAAQSDIVAAWQLLAAGWTRRRIERQAEARAWTVVHPGVYALVQSPLTQLQVWFAAVLSEPGTVLSHASAGQRWRFLSRYVAIPVVTRAGSGGRRQLGGLLVFRSLMLEGDTTTLEGLPITTAERTLIDLAPHESRNATARNVREALRLDLTSPRALAGALGRHRGWRGTRKLWDLAGQYAGIPYGRTRSNAEARALEVLYDAGLSPSGVNRRIAGEEADLIWFERRLIVEVDGPQFHRFPDEDARKQSCWEGAGYEVRRIPSDVVYADPDALIALAAHT